MVVIIWHVRAVAVRPPGATIMPVEMLSYVELGERLKISPEAARALVKRHRLPRSRSNTGKTLVHVDLTEISHSPVTRAPPTPASIDARQRRWNTAQPTHDGSALNSTRPDAIPAEAGRARRRVVRGIADVRADRR